MGPDPSDAAILLVAATTRELCGHDGLACGVGPVEAAAATARALALARPAAVLHVGLAGAAHGLQPVQLAIGAESVYRDLSAAIPLVTTVRPAAALLHAAHRALPGVPAVPIETSAAVTAAGNTVSQGPQVEAMEGFGVLRAAELAGVPAVEVRAISNALGEQDRARWRIEEALDALAGAIPPLLGAIADAVRAP
jgi:nucleoside phosphorylase